MMVNNELGINSFMDVHLFTMKWKIVKTKNQDSRAKSQGVGKLGDGRREKVRVLSLDQLKGSSRGVALTY